MGGCCCSCFGGGDDDDEQGDARPTREMELQAKKAAKSLAISASMSASTIRLESGKISGTGLALAGVPIEQDAAYWEWHVDLPAQTHVDTILFGVTGKKDRKFYKELSDKIQQEEGTPSEVNGTQWMRRVEVQKGDVVGVAVQQSDLPMLQFYLNGECLHESAVNRFRGMVYPSICLPDSTAETLKISLVLAENGFQQMSPGPRFGPLIVVRSLV